MIAKTALLASLIAAMVLAFSATDAAGAEDRHPKDKTLERAQEKQDRELVLQKIQRLADEQAELTEKLLSEDDQSDIQRLIARLDEIESELEGIERDNHENDIPQPQLDGLIGQKDAFEGELLQSDAMRFVTTVGIDITSREIQVGLNADLVDPSNIDSIVDDLQEMMPAGAGWHVVLSEIARPPACGPGECEPVAGGGRTGVPGTAWEAAAGGAEVQAPRPTELSPSEAAASVLKGGVEVQAPRPPELSIIGWGVIISIGTATGVAVYLWREKKRRVSSV